jgi:hypothetical protein
MSPHLAISHLLCPGTTMPRDYLCTISLDLRGYGDGNNKPLRAPFRILFPTHWRCMNGFLSYFPLVHAFDMAAEDGAS